MKKELVISAFDRDYNWVNEVNQDVKITVYRKGETSKIKENEIFLTPNVGRDVHTFFNHIYSNYDNLSDILFFVQDFPFDHWGNLIEVLNSDEKFMKETCSLNFGGYYGFHNNTLGTAWSLSDSKHFTPGKTLFCFTNGAPQDMMNNVNVDKYWDLLFDTEKPNWYEFIPGGHFAITKEQILTRKKELYKKIVELLENDNNSPWNIERLECYLLNSYYKTKY